MKRITNLSALCFVFALFLSANLFAQKRDIYELKTYHITSPAQEAMLDSYLEKAFMPAAHRLGIAKVGVFKPGRCRTKGLCAYSF